MTSPAPDKNVWPPCPGENKISGSTVVPVCTFPGAQTFLSVHIFWGTDILVCVFSGRQHGWGIAQRIQQVSAEALQVGQGSLYPALQRLEQKGWIDSDWQRTEENRRARYYRLTAAGTKALRAETASWRRYVEAVELVLAMG